jgi:hypothetical protein
MEQLTVKLMQPFKIRIFAFYTIKFDTYFSQRRPDFCTAAIRVFLAYGLDGENMIA